MNNKLKKSCNTIIGYDNLNEPIYKKKMVYETMDEAISACKILNGQPDRLQKVVSYKCKICFKYHIGRNGKPIKDKDKINEKSVIRKGKRTDNIKNWDNAQFNIIGKIDLTKIPKK